jgi:glutamine---fructose-6-phosphate transaminase (isomerizing)
MCGVIGLICQESRNDLGKIAAELLKTLEYRGYDSTGAAIQGDGNALEVLKGVGAPSLLVDQLGITKLGGQIFCGQVRWATFGAVDKLNAQPHLVRCKEEVYGAHNGNVTNCDNLKSWLASEGHLVLSDNDGEMVVHTIEHYFSQELHKLLPAARSDHQQRRLCMRIAIATASARLRGSYSAVVVDPVSRCLWAIKRGSSLYFGAETTSSKNRLAIASSDLSAVLRLTRVLVPLVEGEFVEYDASGYQVYRLPKSSGDPLKTGQAVSEPVPVEKTPVRSRLRAKDTALLPAFDTFMDQEICAQARTCQRVVDVFSGGTEAVRLLAPFLEAVGASDLAAINTSMEKIFDEFASERIASRFRELVDSPPFAHLLDSFPEKLKVDGTNATAEQLAERLASSEAGFLADLLEMARDRNDLLAVRVLDVIREKEEVNAFTQAVERFVTLCLDSLGQGGRIFAICCGTSYHAAKAAAFFFHEVAGMELIPTLPGEFRAQFARSLRDGDLFVAISQSGETKDLIDIINDVIRSGRKIKHVAVVNNINSTLALEKSDLVIPLRCGPEIAVPATKSFVNQMAIFYGLALSLGDKQQTDASQKQALHERWERFPRLPELIKETFEATENDIERAAQLLYLAPSIHILATRITAVAKEGALKIREVVLNHTEGYEGSEFKHGPNTILGFNTIFGPLEVDRLLKRIGTTLQQLSSSCDDLQTLSHMIQTVTDSVFSPSSTLLALSETERALLEKHVDRSELIDELYDDYPLIYVSGPDPRDVALTVSQINTHKIRGAITTVIAEDHPDLRQAATKAPANNPGYRSVYVTLPRTNDTLMTVFSSTIVLQRMALRMSLLKMAYLDRIGIKEHGVHPDVPKNVSKSITVD